jgi:hypothetical protein
MPYHWHLHRTACRHDGRKSVLGIERNWAWSLLLRFFWVNFILFLGTATFWVTRLNLVRAQPTLMYHSLPWCITACPGVLQPALVYHSLPWRITACPDVSQPALVYHSLPWCITACPGVSQPALVHHSLPWPK